MATALCCLASVTSYAEDITGAGSTFAAPIYSKWGEANSNTKLNYQAIGSGAGINQINNRTVDFGASDMPVKAEDLVVHKLFQFPTVIGAVNIIVNVPGIKTNTLKLTGDVLAKIYMGEITKWNDKDIVALNPTLKLPSLAIAPVHRADGSGTTFVFTDYLGMVNSTWKTKVGASTSVSWPVGAGAKGSDGVAGTVHQIPGGIGYDESAYAAHNHLTTVLLQNKDGKFVTPSMDSYKSAAANADWATVQNFAVDLNNESGANSWPIESATFVLLPTDSSTVKADAVRGFFEWAFTNGNNIALNLQYVPLPDTVKTAIQKAWK